MRATTLTVGPLAAASANNIALSQTPTAAFTLNGSTAGVLDTPRRVLITTAANESAKTITIVGTNASGLPQTELITGPNIGTAYTALDFATVTSASISSAAAGAITLGTNGIASSRWMRMDDFAPTQATIGCTVTGTVNYTVQITMQDADSPTNVVAPYSVVWNSHPDPSIVAATTTQMSFNAYCPSWMKVTLNSGTGSVSTVITQNSATPR